MALMFWMGMLSGIILGAFGLMILSVLFADRKRKDKDEDSKN